MINGVIEIGSQNSRWLNTVKSSANYQAKKVAVCAGAWSAHLLKKYNFPLIFLGKALVWFDMPPNYFSFQDGNPCFAFDTAEGFFYGFTAINNRIKVARHSGGVKIDDPSALEKYDLSEEIEVIINFFRKYFSISEFKVAQAASCMYTNTPDNNFIIKEIDEGISVVAGLSGYGYKMSNVLGFDISE